MTMEQIRKELHGRNYEFLRTNEHLKDQLVFLTLGGSYAYGTNIETSDVDVRGCALNAPSEILGLASFEQFVDTETDTVVYSFNKLIQLLLNCNPNTVELLGCKPEHYFYMTEIGRELLENRNRFLSRRVVDSFGGYAATQLRRLENALARDRVSQTKKEEHILRSMQGTMRSFDARYSRIEQGGLKLYTADSTKEGMELEIFADIHLERYPVREFNGILNELTNVVRCYDKLSHRNRKKDEAHLDKHAMHLIRLHLMCLDILERGEIVTCREKERELLMSIRRGSYRKEDGTYRSEFFDLVTQMEQRTAYAEKNTDLPEKPDMKWIEEFVMEVNRKSISR